MGNTGVGMLLGNTSVIGVWMLFIGAFVLGGAILYGLLQTGRLSRGERAQLDPEYRSGSAPGRSAEVT